MAEENKNQETQEQKPSCCCSCSAGKVIAGLAMIILGLLAVVKWWVFIWAIVKGCAGIVLILMGAITIAVAKE